MIKSLIGILLLSIASHAQSQNVLGFSEDEVKTYFKSNYPGLVLEANTKNNTYRYLKYSDISTNLITALIFIDKEGSCSAVRFIYDLSMENDIIEELNKKYEKTGEEYMWIDSVSGRKKVNIFFKKEDWFITVNYKEE
jgi:hypothetical protein